MTAHDHNTSEEGVPCERPSIRNDSLSCELPSNGSSLALDGYDVCTSASAGCLTIGKSEAKELHARHMDYIHQMMQKQRASKQQEAEVLERQLVQRTSLARRVLASSSVCSRSTTAARASATELSNDACQEGGENPESLKLPKVAASSSSAPASSASPSKRPSLRRGCSMPLAATGTLSNSPPRRQPPTAQRDASPSGEVAQHDPLTALYERAKQQQAAQAAALHASSNQWEVAYLQWRTRHHIPQGVKVFCIAGSGNHSHGVREALLRRGWVENKDHNSRWFDFKWAVRCSEIEHNTLWPGQVVNHFSRASCITTKAGLCRLIRQLCWFEDADHREFYPRCFEMHDEVDQAAWLVDIRLTAAEALVRRAAAQGFVGVEPQTLRLALRACAQKLAADSYLSEQDEEGALGDRLSEQEWAIVVGHRSLSRPPVEAGGAAYQPQWCSQRRFITESRPNISKRKKCKKDSPSADPCASDLPNGRHREYQVDEQLLLGEHPELNPGAVDGDADGARINDQQMPDDPACIDLSRFIPHSQGLLLGFMPADVKSMGEARLLQAAEHVLEVLDARYAQSHANGMNNMWIVKPAGKSRGRGIRVFNCPQDALQYVGDETSKGESQWIAQKYVERPLTIRGRKFDLRQWVLVTDWNPLAVWFYDSCYLRFAAEDYDAATLDITQHLCNNSITKYHTANKEDEFTATGNMWDIPAFREWLVEVHGTDAMWQDLIQPAMKHIVICTLKSAQDMIKARKGSCQLYGYDFLVDAEMRVWLLEINSSPTMEYSTPVTTNLCAAVQDDIVKVTVDLPEQLARQPKSNLCGHRAGGFVCIAQGGTELQRPAYMGANLELQGSALQLPGRHRKPADPVPAVYKNFAAKLRSSMERLVPTNVSAIQVHPTSRRASSPGPSIAPASIHNPASNLPAAAGAAPRVVREAPTSITSPDRRNSWASDTSSGGNAGGSIDGSLSAALPRTHSQASPASAAAGELPSIKVLKRQASVPVVAARSRSPPQRKTLQLRIQELGA